MSSEASKPRAIAAVDWVFATHRFPAFALFLVVLYKLLLVSILLVPPARGGLSAFAEEFKTWCFGWDPATGKLQPMYVLTMLAEPLVLGGGVLLLWGRALRDTAKRRPRALVPSALVALAVVIGASASFGALRKPESRDGAMPFPAEELRTSFATPTLELTDQEGQHVSLASLRGRVVLITGVYASCGLTCPMIMGQAKKALAQLDPNDRDEVSVVAVTLDPEHDDVARLRQMAEGQGVHAPEFHLVTGDPKVVDGVLDDLSIARKRDPQTGVIEHANLFVLVDRKGTIAYRFALGPQQQSWLPTALRMLVREGRKGAEEARR